MAIEGCAICQSRANPYHSTMYGAKICRFCHRYLDAYGSNAHGRKPRSLLGDFASAWRDIVRRIPLINTAIGRKTPLLNEYFLYGLPPDWEARCKSVKKRDGEKCALKSCGSAAGLFVHHIKPVARGGLHYLDNLLTVCEKCRDIAHTALSKKIKEEQSDKAAVLCPTHSRPMKRAKITWGDAAPKVTTAGRQIRFGYICGRCDDEVQPRPVDSVTVRYFLEAGEVVPLAR